MHYWWKCESALVLMQFVEPTVQSAIASCHSKWWYTFRFGRKRHALRKVYSFNKLLRLHILQYTWHFKAIRFIAVLHQIVGSEQFCAC